MFELQGASCLEHSTTCFSKTEPTGCMYLWDSMEWTEGITSRRCLVSGKLGTLPMCYLWLLHSQEVIYTHIPHLAVLSLPHQNLVTIPYGSTQPTIINSILEVFLLCPFFRFNDYRVVTDFMVFFLHFHSLVRSTETVGQFWSVSTIYMNLAEIWRDT